MLWRSFWQIIDHIFDRKVSYGHIVSSFGYLSRFGLRGERALSHTANWFSKHKIIQQAVNRYTLLVRVSPLSLYFLLFYFIMVTFRTFSESRSSFWWANVFCGNHWANSLSPFFLLFYFIFTSFLWLMFCFSLILHVYYVYFLTSLRTTTVHCIR